MTAVINKTDIRIGDYVRTHKHGHEGFVVQIHLTGCPEGPAWQMGQEVPLVEGEADMVWFSVLCEPAGSVVVSEIDIERAVAPADPRNPWLDEYFRL